MRQRRFRYPGRARTSDRAALEGILFAARTGVSWNALPTAAFGASGACRCRKIRPGRSSGMSIFVEDAAESIVSSDVEVGESVRFGDRLGERAYGCRGVERSVGSVLVVEGLVLAERVEKMGPGHDQGPVEQFGSA
ncbi:transposase [Dactylosporangium cerinum]|uniref:Transposase n=1 Tax=Dactylosporangium cerinum TaxID=1434730 RepID=A0ABV9W6Y7_9ACTN